MAEYLPVHLETSHNIVVLCNNELAFPAIRALAFYGVLKAVVVPDKNKEIFETLKHLLLNSGINLISVSRKNLVESVKLLIADTRASSAWLMTFPYIIPASLLAVLPGKFINFHYGILPKYRGANPVLAQMLQYESHGGITVHVMDEEIDNGPIIIQQKIPIEAQDTFGIQLGKLGALGAELALYLLKILQFSTHLPAVAQDKSQAAYFKKVTAADLMIDWKRMTSVQVIRLINACNPWNKGAGAVIDNKVVCLVEAEISGDVVAENMVAGTITELSDKDGLNICCCDGKSIRVNIIYLQQGFLSGKNLAKFGIRAGDLFV